MKETQLKKILAAHARWIESERTRGKQARFVGLDLSEIDLSGAHLEMAHFTRCDLTDANFTGANLKYCRFTYCDLGSAKLVGASLDYANFCLTNLYRADLTRAKLHMANFDATFLAWATLKAADLRSGIFNLSNLGAANLDYANLTHVLMRFVNMRGASLRRADLRGSGLEGVDLGEVDLDRAKLAYARIEADFDSAAIKNANLGKTNVAGSRFTLTRGHLYAFAQVAFTGHGECGRTLTAIQQTEDSPIRFSCGCFDGSEADLLAFIEAGNPDLRATRLLALETALKLIAVQPAKKRP